MDTTFYNQDLGGYMIRRCGGSWDYCNGQCDSCNKSKVTVSDHTTPHSNKTYTITDRSIPNGVPSYLVRRDIVYDI